MPSQTQLTGVNWQPSLVVRRVPNGMHSRRQLGANENDDEKKMAQRIHGLILIDLDEQPFEVFAFGKVEGYRMIGSAGQAANDARFAPGMSIS